MKVSSPVGEFPFDAERLRIDGLSVRLEGRMGAWPAHVQIEASDAVRFLRLAGPLLAGPLIGVAVLGAVTRRRRSCHGR